MHGEHLGETTSRMLPSCILDELDAQKCAARELQLYAFMDEHDDDLMSEVTEGAEEETDDFPATADELEDKSEDDEEEAGAAEDESEI
jgi:hypothetical protein